MADYQSCLHHPPRELRRERASIDHGMRVPSVHKMYAVNPRRRAVVTPTTNDNAITAATRWVENDDTKDLEAKDIFPRTPGSHRTTASSGETSGGGGVRAGDPFE